MFGIEHLTFRWLLSISHILLFWQSLSIKCHLVLPLLWSYYTVIAYIYKTLINYHFSPTGSCVPFIGFARDFVFLHCMVLLQWSTSWQPATLCDYIILTGALGGAGRAPPAARAQARLYYAGCARASVSPSTAPWYESLWISLEILLYFFFIFDTYLLWYSILHFISRYVFFKQVLD